MTDEVDPVDSELVDPPRRTLLASERTELAWVRTGLTALAVAVGVGRIAPALGETTEWPFAVLGVCFGLYGIALIAWGKRPCPFTRRRHGGWPLRSRPRDGFDRDGRGGCPLGLWDDRPHRRDLVQRSHWAPPPVLVPKSAYIRSTSAGHRIPRSTPIRAWEPPLRNQEVGGSNPPSSISESPAQRQAFTAPSWRRRATWFAVGDQSDLALGPGLASRAQPQPGSRRGSTGSSRCPEPVAQPPVPGTKP